MVNEGEKFLQERHVEENGKVRGAFLAGAPAAIAFAFHETSDRSLDWALLPILLAVIAWGGSFVAGIWAARHMQSTIKCNIILIRAENKGDENAVKLAESDFKMHRDKSWKFQESQMWLLFIGAFFYLVGHTWHIANNASA